MGKMFGSVSLDFQVLYLWVRVREKANKRYNISRDFSSLIKKKVKMNQIKSWH
jgi:hypothetical protein